MRREVAKLGQRSLVDEAALAEDADAVAERLDLAEDVRGEEHRLPALLRLLHRLPEGHLHQRVEPARRLVEDQQVGPARERRDELHLLAVALRECPHLLVELEPEALDENVAVGDVGPAAQPREIGEGLGAGQARPEERLAGDVADPPVRGDRLAPGVDPEELGAAIARAVQAEQQADRRRLPRPVRAEVAVHLARRDGEIERLEGERSTRSACRAPRCGSRPRADSIADSPLVPPPAGGGAPPRRPPDGVRGPTGAPRPPGRVPMA